VRTESWHRIILLPFVFACSSSQSAKAQDLWYYDLTRQEFFTQATTNRAATGTAVMHALFGGLEPIPGSSLKVVALNSPVGAGGWLLLLDSHGTGFVTSYKPDETSQLAGPAVNGQYLFQALTTSGVTENYETTLPPPVNAFAPLRVGNFVEAQNVDSSKPFILRWDKVIGTKLH
jgi:hypothetical protein